MPTWSMVKNIYSHCILSLLTANVKKITRLLLFETGLVRVLMVLFSSPWFVLILGGATRLDFLYCNPLICFLFSE